MENKQTGQGHQNSRGSHSDPMMIFSIACQLHLAKCFEDKSLHTLHKEEYEEQGTVDCIVVTCHLVTAWFMSSDFQAESEVLGGGIILTITSFHKVNSYMVSVKSFWAGLNLSIDPKAR